MKQKLYEILVPCVMDGKPVRRKHHQEWDKVVRKFSNGLTLHGVSKGQWKNPETKELVVERMIPVRFTATEAQMRQIGSFTLGHYRQHTVMVAKISDEVWFFENR